MVLIKNKLRSKTQNKLLSLFKKKLRKRPLVKGMIIGKNNLAGRNNYGKITVYHKGGGHRKKYRKIDFVRNDESSGVVTSLEYDPYRTAFIASIYDFLNSKYSYILAPKNINVGSIVKTGFYADSKAGHCLPLTKIPVGSLVHNISLKLNTKAQLVRSAGTSAQLIEITPQYCRVILNSGAHKFISPACQATIGVVSNEFSFLKTVNKAGRNR